MEDGGDLWALIKKTYIKLNISVMWLLWCGTQEEQTEQTVRLCS